MRDSSVLVTCLFQIPSLDYVTATTASHNPCRFYLLKILVLFSNILLRPAYLLPWEQKGSFKGKKDGKIMEEKTWCRDSLVNTE